MGVIMHDDVQYGGVKGDRGITPSITASATVDATVGTPSVDVVQGGTDEDPTIAFNFHNLKGIQGDSAPSESLLKDTVGWVGKNDLEILDSVVTKTEGGVTITVTRNSKGQVTEIDADTNGSPSSARVDFYLNNVGIPIDNNKSYILNGCTGGAGNTYRLQLLSSDSSVVKSCENSEVTINGSDYSGKTVHARITIYSGTTLNHVKFYPMLRDASITDSTFEPYHKSVEDWYWENNPNAGAKNKLPNTASNQSSNNVAYTVNANKSVTIATTGTASADAVLIINNGTADMEVGKNYILSGNEPSLDAYIYIRYVKNGNVGYIQLTTNAEEEFTYDGTWSSYDVRIVVKSGQTVNKTVYPMLRDAADTDSTYVPYAMTNRELTEKVLDHSTLTYTEITEKGMKIRFQRKKDMVTISFTGELTEAVASAVKLCDIPSGFRLDMQYQATIICREIVSGGIKMLDVYSDQILANGALNVGDKIRGSGTFAAQ